MMFRRSHWLIVAITLTTLSPSKSFAWNAAGHKAIALIAYQECSPEVRAKVVGILRNFERYEEDFKTRMPEELADADPMDVERWHFAQASVWPDLARGFKGDDLRKFHRSTWHYINFPIFLNDKSEKTISKKITVNLDTELTTKMKGSDINAEGKMNIAQALEKSIAKLDGDSSSDASKALFTCWLFHLLGDAHQPLHSSALFSKYCFPRGDKGGNTIRARSGQSFRSSSLHSLWDGMLGRGTKLNDAKQKVYRIRTNEDLVGIGEKAALNVEPISWLSESHNLAKSAVYVPQVLDAVNAAESDRDVKKLKIIVLSDQYFQDGGEVSEKRALEAGFRLAAILNSIFGNK